MCALRTTDCPEYLDLLPASKGKFVTTNIGIESLASSNNNQGQWRQREVSG
jgi:hypothetical protein